MCEGEHGFYWATLLNVHVSIFFSCLFLRVCLCGGEHVPQCTIRSQSVRVGSLLLPRVLGTEFRPSDLAAGILTHSHLSSLCYILGNSLTHITIQTSAMWTLDMFSTMFHLMFIDNKKWPPYTNLTLSFYAGRTQNGKRVLDHC